MRHITQTIEAHGVQVEESKYEPKYHDLDSDKIACFTGHRKISNNIIGGIKQGIDKALEMGVNHFFVGMAKGTDQLAATILIQRNLPWTAVIPCGDQSKLWSEKEKIISDRLLRYADNQVILRPKYTVDCMHVRNRYMIDHSDVCIAIYDGKLTGGTANTYRLALKKKLPIIQINPSLRRVSVYQPPKPKHTQFSLF
ncbi:SLOG family protein [Cronbergia sp. UHCC 0137]|uniref:SLOG family protein n=1 Tax=Cronbergia sp. UHCC 0137 TaxID=3110239 RepID=UPI002B201A20|nr:SLOG family protein [Cronbergia sp. UHCC 0137]MEA5619934.1 SLOG family protein [Cronbergia sp. UHCC 0137]